MKKTYLTLAAARNAFALDTGFDPFSVGMKVEYNGVKYSKPTCWLLAMLGYPVDQSGGQDEIAEGSGYYSGVGPSDGEMLAAGFTEKEIREMDQYA